MLEPALAKRIAAAAIFFAFAACSPAAAPPDGQATAPQTATLRSKLAALGGTYTWNEEVKAFVFSDKPAIESIIGSATDQKISELVDCLDDSTPSRTTLKGASVMLGILCYEALTQTVYYEPTTRSGDVAQHWPGHIAPTASVSELAAAKQAWIDVVRKKAYKRL